MFERFLPQRQQDSNIVIARTEHELGLLTSSWEDPAVEGRPRRRLYELTGRGVHVAERAGADQAAGRVPRLAPGPA